MYNGRQVKSQHLGISHPMYELKENLDIIYCVSVIFTEITDSFYT